MLKVLIIVISIFLSVIGLSEILHKLWLFLLRPTKNTNFIVTILDENFAAEQITAILEDMRWNGKNSARALMGINLGIGNEKFEACRMIEQLNSDFVIVTPETLFDEIKKRS